MTLKPKSGLKTGPKTGFDSALLAYDVLSIAVAICDRGGRISYCNTAFKSLFCLGSADCTRFSMTEFFADWVSNTRQQAQLAPGVSQTLLLNKGNGAKFWAQVSVSRQKTEDAGQTHVIQITDIDCLKRDHDTLEYREQTWRNAIADSHHGVWDYYASTDEIYLSDEWKVLRGIPVHEPVEMFTKDWAKNIHPDDLDRVREVNRKHDLGELDSFAYEYREQRRDGQWIWIFSQGRAVERDAQNRPTRVVGMDVDITKFKEEEEKRLREVEKTYQTHLAELEKANSKAERARRSAAIISNLDALTGLANRRAFSTHLREFTGAGARESAVSFFYLFLIDLDRFKPINDTYGHSIGDKVIRETATRIKSSLCDRAVVARLGGDEFGVIIPCIDPENGDENARVAASGVIDAIHQPIYLNDMRLEIGASIGISRFPECGKSESLLLRRADIAMYEAKKDKLTGISFFAPWMERKVISRAKLESDVRNAVQKQHFIPYFQPIINLSSGCLRGFEALARWGQVEHGHVGPGTFIPIIEQNGLMSKFGAAMLEATFTTARNWGKECKISFNLTANGICSEKICENILNIMKREAFPPEQFIVEVSEMAIVSDIDAASKNMRKLRDHGIEFALDDFGVGYSGLSYLRSLSFEILKLDRSFISTMSECAESKKIVHSVLSLADQFGMATVAEGIENEDILNQVQSAGFSYGQGYYFERAIPAEQANELVCGRRSLSLKAG